MIGKEVVEQLIKLNYHKDIYDRYYFKTLDKEYQGDYNRYHSSGVIFVDIETGSIELAGDEKLSAKLLQEYKINVSL